MSYFDDGSWRERNSCCFLDPYYQNWEAGENMTDWKCLFWVCNYAIQAFFSNLRWYQADLQGKKVYLYGKVLITCVYDILLGILTYT